MKTFFKLTAWLMFAVCAPWVQGAAAQGKIAVLDLQEAILSTERAKQQMKAFDARPDITKMIADAENLRKALTALRTELSGDRLAAAKVDETRKQMDYKQAEFELLVRKLNTERTQASKKMLDEIGPRLEDIVRGIIKQEGIGLLLDKKAAMHAEPAFDITSKVTERLNASIK